MGLNSFLDDIRTAVNRIINDKASFQKINTIPDTIPLEGNHWLELDEVTCVFVDMIGSTQMHLRDQDAVKVYEIFIKSLVKILNTYGAQYIDIKGDGAFGIFSGNESAIPALCSAVTFRTVCSKILENKFTDFHIKTHIGMDTDRVLVKRIGLRGDKNNEVWVGKPVNIASKLASLAPESFIYASDRTYQTLLKKDYMRSLIKSCGCPDGVSMDLWTKEDNTHAFLKLQSFYSLGSCWCAIHGEEFCGAVMDIYRQRNS